MAPPLHHFSRSFLHHPASCGIDLSTSNKHSLSDSRSQAFYRNPAGKGARLTCDRLGAQQSHELGKEAEGGKARQCCFQEGEPSFPSSQGNSKFKSSGAGHTWSVQRIVHVVQVEVGDEITKVVGVRSHSPMKATGIWGIQRVKWKPLESFKPSNDIYNLTYIFIFIFFFLRC